MEVAVRGLLTVHDDAVPLTRTIAVDGLAASFNKAESKDYARSDAAITNRTLTISQAYFLAIFSSWPTYEYAEIPSFFLEF